MKCHDLKILPPHFKDVSLGIKPYEIRRNDRDFQKGDYLLLREWDGVAAYTGNSVMVCISHILDEFEGLKDGYVVLGLNEVISR